MLQLDTRYVTSRPRAYTVRVHAVEPGSEFGWGEGAGYWADVPALPGCVARGETVEVCLHEARRAIEHCRHELIASGGPVPEEDTLTSAVVTVHVS